MSAFWDILDLLSSPPGALVYYLILLFSIWAIVGLALSQWSRGERGGLVARLLFAGALMSFSRFFLIIMALLSRQGDLSLVRFAPPLERFVDALAALLVCWAFVFPHRYRIAGRVALGTLVLLTLVLYALSAVSWMNILDASPLATYNGSTMQSRIWEAWQLGFLIPAFVYTLVHPARERDALNIGLGVLVVGHLLQLVYPLAERIDHWAAWTRFANLIAFPMFGVATYQLVIQCFDAQTTDLKSVNQESLAQMAGLVSVLDTNRKVFASLDLDTILQNSVQAIAQVLQSDLCALFLLVPQAANDLLEHAGLSAQDDDLPDALDLADAPSPADVLALPNVWGPPDVPSSPTPSEEVELAAMYGASCLIDGGQRLRVRLRVGEYPAIQRALVQSSPLVLEVDARGSLDQPQVTGDLGQIYRLLGYDKEGALLIQPLEHASAVIGVVLAFRAQDQGSFTTSEARKSEIMAASLGTAISNARQHTEIQARLGQLVTELDAAETGHTRLRADLENRLTRTQEQATLYMQRLYEAEQGEQQAQEDAQQARRKLASLRQESQTEIAHARDELKHSIQQVAHLTHQIANLDAQCLKLGNLVQALEQEKGLLQLRLAVAATEQDAPGADSDPKLEQASPLGRSDSPAAGIRSTDALLTALTHDLGAPVASILEYTELFANSMAGRLEHRHDELLKRVQANAERMQGVLNNLISLSAMDGGAPVLKRADVDVAKLIEVALSISKFRLEEKKLKTRLEIGVLPTLQVDPVYMQQIVDNLVSYACRFSRIGTTMDIRAYTSVQDSSTSQLHITVSGTNTGSDLIAQESRYASSRTLHRANSAQRANLEESQAELEIIKTLAGAHQGQILCESEPGIGTTFHLTIPIEPVQTPEHREDGRG